MRSKTIEIVSLVCRTHTTKKDRRTKKYNSTTKYVKRSLEISLRVTERVLAFYNIQSKFSTTSENNPLCLFSEVQRKMFCKKFRAEFLLRLLLLLMFSVLLKIRILIPCFYSPSQSASWYCFFLSFFLFCSLLFFDRSEIQNSAVLTIGTRAHLIVVICNEFVFFFKRISRWIKNSTWNRLDRRFSLMFSFCFIFFSFSRIDNVKYVTLLWHFQNKITATNDTVRPLELACKTLLSCACSLLSKICSKQIRFAYPADVCCVMRLPSSTNNDTKRAHWCSHGLLLSVFVLYSMCVCLAWLCCTLHLGCALMLCVLCAHSANCCALKSRLNRFACFHSPSFYSFIRRIVADICCLSIQQTVMRWIFRDVGHSSTFCWLQLTHSVDKIETS